MRFKEYCNSYEYIPLGKCLKIRSGRDQKQVEQIDGKYNIYGSGGIIGKTNHYLYNKPSVCIGRKGTIDRPYYLDQPFWTVDTLFYSEIFAGYYPKYLYYLFQTIPWKLYNTSTGVPSLTSSSIEGIEKAFPQENEQKKIATFLTLIDEKIDTQNKIIEDKKIVMNNLMYRLFNDCNQFSTLSHFIKFGKAGGTPKSTNSSYYNGDIPFLSISDISNQGKYINYTNKTITQDGLDNSSAWIVPSNSLILSMYASVGYPAINSIPLATSQAMFAMVLNDQSDLDFLYYFLLFFQKHKLNNLLETGTQSNINADTVKSIKVPIFEANTKEQIVNLLNALYKSIENEKDILNKYITQKEYLLSNLFI